MNRSVVRKIAGALFILAGLIALWSAITLFKMDEGSFPQDVKYGGDAYTGMQNAAASAARNVKWLYELVAKGFGAILNVLSFAMFGFGVKSFAPDPASAPSDPAPAQKTPAPTASSGKWLCPHCQTPNEMKRLFCSQCAAPRVSNPASAPSDPAPAAFAPETPVAPPAPAPETPAPEASSGKWLCPHCQTPNEMKRLVCSQCGAPRGDAAASESRNKKGLESWVCPDCKRKNAMTDVQCKSCGRFR